MPDNPRWFSPPLYGLTRHCDIFTARQLVTLNTFTNLIKEVEQIIFKDACAAKFPQDDVSLEDGGKGAKAYSNSIMVYLAFGLSRLMDLSSTLCPWSSNPAHELVVHMFARQAIPMTWDFGEINPFCQAASWSKCLEFIPKVLDKLPSQNSSSNVSQRDAITNDALEDKAFCVSTDPPYYDAIGYADLSDFFYVWLRRSIGNIYPSLFKTLLTPKSEELIATPHRFSGSKEKAKEYFEKGLSKVFSAINSISHSNYPFSVFYAFKQAESEEGDDSGSVFASTGWETMLGGLLSAGFSVNGTWPVRTERPTGIKLKINALASSIVLVCRPRPADAPSTTRRRFVDELKSELPDALKKLQQGNIAPVDLAQASIGPGMAIFSRYAKVLESDGSPMRVRTALQLINQTLDEFLTEQEGEFDTDTRWALAWFEQYQFNEGQFGDAETLSKAKNTSIKGMVDAGILAAKAGKVQLIPRDALSADWNPAKDSRISVWEATQYLIRALDQTGEMGAAHLLSQLGNLGEIARDLAYRLYSICDRKGWTQEAIAYNSLVISWAEIARLATEKQHSTPTQIELGI